MLRCFDLQTGEERWRFAYLAKGELPFPGSRNTPRVDDEMVYFVGAFGHVHAVDRKTHKPVWSHHLVREFPRKREAEGDAEIKPRRSKQWGRSQVPRWGFTQCPLLYDQSVIVAPLSETVGLVAYDRKSGRVKWRSKFIGRSWFSHASPYLTTLHGVDQIITLTNAHAGRGPRAVITGLDARTGEILWQRTTWKSYNMPIPQPVRLDKETLFFSGGYRIGCFTVEVSRDGGEWSTAWGFKDNDHLTAHIQTPIHYDGHIYGNSFDKFHNGKRGNNGLVCLNTDGELRWKTGPDTHFDSGNLIIADGKLYIMNGATGTLHMAAASPDGYKPLDKANVLKGKDEEVWAPMALSDGRLVVRDLWTLKCLDVRDHRPTR